MKKTFTLIAIVLFSILANAQKDKVYYSLEKALKTPEQVYMLILVDNQLTNLPVEIGNLTNLTELYLRKNKLTSLPKELENLTKLKILDISSNNFSKEEVNKIKIIYAKSYLYYYLEEALIIPKNVYNLDLSYKELTNLPTEIEKLTNLTYLDLSYNQLTNLPPEIEKLSNLTYCNLYFNQLTKEEQEKIKKLLPNCKIEF